MSDREMAIQILKDSPDNISIAEIFETLYNVFDLKNRIDNLDINEAVTTEELLEEMKTW